jgi:hypothetical protein
MIDFVTQPLVILGGIAVALAVVLPWLKKRAEQTETVTDDKIITYIQIILSELARKLMKTKFFLILACFVLLQSCVFTGYGARYETGNYMTVTAKDGPKTFTAVVSVKDEPSALYAVADKIRAMFERWCR